MLTNEDINIRDPFVLVHDDTYYLYGTRGNTCWGEATGFDCYIGKDLKQWEGPYEVFHNDGNFWADRNYWAPECHYYNGNFYIFASFKSEDRCRGTQILKCKEPAGKYQPITDFPITPKDWECLDGTFYVSKEGKPYIVFCHEWVQIHDGTICALELSKDLTHSIGEPIELMKASDAKSWIQPVKTWREGINYVTDGPSLHRMKNGSLIMIWSSMSKGGYTVGIARSDNGEITGHWTQVEEPLFFQDGGHGMIFTGLDQTLYLTLHSPNETLKERPVFYPLKEDGDNISLR